MANNPLPPAPPILQKQQDILQISRHLGESQQYLSNEARGLIVGRREGRKMDKGEKEQCISGGQEEPIQWSGVIWMEGACSLNLAKEEEK